VCKFPRLPEPNGRSHGQKKRHAPLGEAQDTNHAEQKIFGRWSNNSQYLSDNPQRMRTREKGTS
jgi:hypothetical protein